MVYWIVQVLGVRVMMNWSPIMRRSVPGSWYAPPGVCCIVAIHCLAVRGSSSIHVSPLKGGARSMVRLSCVGSWAGVSEVGSVGHTPGGAWTGKLAHRMIPDMRILYKSGYLTVAL